MSTAPIGLTNAQMASFAARGFLRFDGVVPETINQRFLADIGQGSDSAKSMLAHYGEIMQGSVIPLVAAGTPLQQAYPDDNALKDVMAVPEVAGAINALVGPDCVVDHHFLHITFPPDKDGIPADKRVSQATHQDSTIDPRQAFDIQVFYFPHAVTREMGGTRFIPGTHFRVVSEAAIARYQNIAGQQHVVCPAGTVIIFHMGLWHGGGLNTSDDLRYMFKTRLAPTRRQLKLWEEADHATPAQRPIFWTGGAPDPEHLHSILTTPEPWFEADTGRLEYLNRVRFWRYVSGDDNFDADYWVTRVENEYSDTMI